eukprot:scaffold29786_cov65-Phaeocystis_antarctica.AAC.3
MYEHSHLHARTHAGTQRAVRARGQRRNGRARVAGAGALPHAHLRAQGHRQTAARAGAGGVRLRSDCVSLDAGERQSKRGQAGDRDQIAARC